MLENGQDICNCKRKKCERFGDCAACISHHKTHKHYSLPYCQRKATEQKSKVNKEQKA